MTTTRRAPRAVQHAATIVAALLMLLVLVFLPSLPIWAVLILAAVLAVPVIGGRLWRL